MPYKDLNCQYKYEFDTRERKFLSLSSSILYIYIILPPTIYHKTRNCDQ